MNRILAKRAAAAVAALIILATAGGIGYAIALRSLPLAAGHPAANASRKVLYWYDPMAPQQHFEQPGLSPMGMQLVPKYADETSVASQEAVRVSPAEVQNLGMRTATVEVGRLSGAVHAPGTVAWDPQLAVTVSARTNATIEKLYVRAPFTQVEAGQPLADILAPQWSAAAAEYFALGHAESTEGRALRAAARQRLHALGMDDATIRGLRAGSGTITLRAPIDGVVSTLDVKEGQQVGEGMPIMAINGLGQVWVEVAIPQAQSSGVAAGTSITATVSALPGATFHGVVSQLLPEVDPATRSRRARVVLENPQHALVPGMFADVRVAGAAAAPHPLVPDGAIIADGVDTRVIEALGDGRFRPVRITVGRSSGGMTEVLAGLAGGERIVASGQFLIDSEASLSGALERLGVEPGGPPAGEPEPLSPRERGRGEGSEATRQSGPPGPSSGPSGHLLPQGEGKENAMPGRAVPPSSASHSHGHQP